MLLRHMSRFFVKMGTAAMQLCRKGKAYAESIVCIALARVQRATMTDIEAHERAGLAVVNAGIACQCYSAVSSFVT